MTETMDDTLTTVAQYVDTHYHGISVYSFGDHIRVTNGSAAMFADISETADGLHFEGERYGRTFDTVYDTTMDGIQDGLSETLGL